MPRSGRTRQTRHDVFVGQTDTSTRLNTDIVPISIAHCWRQSIYFHPATHLYQSVCKPVLGTGHPHKLLVILRTNRLCSVGTQLGRTKNADVTRKHQAQGNDIHQFGHVTLLSPVFSLSSFVFVLLVVLVVVSNFSPSVPIAPARNSNSNSNNTSRRKHKNANNTTGCRAGDIGKENPARNRHRPGRHQSRRQWQQQRQQQHVQAAHSTQSAQIRFCLCRHSRFSLPSAG